MPTNMTPHQKIIILVDTAKQRMDLSRDPAHEACHAKRVAAFAEQLAADTKLTAAQTQALVLSAWWHDVSRTLTKKPSIIIMPFIDDILSAFMLWSATIRIRLFGNVAGMATRLIFCKSFGAGAILTHILVRRRNRILIDLLKDADALDTLTQERMIRLLPLIESSRRRRWSYKKLLEYIVTSDYLLMKTKAARVLAIKLLKSFINWIQKGAIYLWHVAQCGSRWCGQMLRHADELMLRLEFLQNTPSPL